MCEEMLRRVAPKVGRAVAESPKTVNAAYDIRGPNVDTAYTFPNPPVFHMFTSYDEFVMQNYLPIPPASASSGPTFKTDLMTPGDLDHEIYLPEQDPHGLP